MVSRKWTFQLSLEFTLPMAAAAPPSAMTVWALPNSDLQMTAVRMPSSRAAMAARRPAPPAPITRTSNSCSSCCSWAAGPVGCCVMACLLADEPEVGDPAGGDGHHVEVRDHQRGEGDPGELH